MSSSADKAPLVLIVEDYEDTREMYSQYLKHSGFRVLEASNGAEAVQAALDERPDLVLMDLALPAVDGWEATRRIKADPRTKQIPIVALTGHALSGHAQGAKAVGCDAFVTKPCLPDDLVVEIRRQLSASRRRQGRAAGQTKDRSRTEVLKGRPAHSAAPDRPEKRRPT
jgi:two-component system cell cycle response regulator DivK